jgi:O-antigen/teichoic acid export membrane protein
VQDTDSIAGAPSYGGLGLPTPLATLARSGVIAGIIKLTSAGLSFFMFVAVALVTDERQFGLFGATYAAASLVSFFSTVGQQAVVLRFWPQYAATDPGAARAHMARSLRLTGVGLVVASLLLVGIGFVPGISHDTPEWLPLCLAASLLAFGLGWSEVASGAMRAKAVLVAGLLPRDVIWRALTIVAMVGLMFAGVSLSAADATWICGGLLLLSVAPQTLRLLRETFADPPAPTPLTGEQEREFRPVTQGLWGVTSRPPALGQVSTLIVAAILGPEIAGAVFVAERTTRLVVVALSGINQALAPEISAEFHRGDRGHVQAISGLSALAATAVAAVALLCFWIMGGFVLAIFEPAYATPTMVAVLLVFGAGATVGSACGPVEILLQLTGGQHALFRILVLVNPVGLALTAIATWLWGPIGAGIGIAATTAAWNILAVVHARRHLGIDPSLLGLVYRPAERRA